MRFRSPVIRSGIVLIFFLCPPLVLASDKPKPETTVREEARVTLVEIPVNVIDKDGRTVENLTVEDFEVYDDGKKQQITGFEVLDQRKALAPPTPGEPPINPAARRHFLLLFDLSFGSPRGIVNARRAARDFVVTRMKELDMAAVATYSVEHGMKLLLTFTRDRTQLAAAIDTLGFPTLAERASDPLSFVIQPPTQSNATGFAYIGNTPRVDSSGFDIAVQEALENMQVLRARNLRAIYRERVVRFLDSFAQMARALDSVQGRKHIFYLSEGFDSRELSGSTVQGGGAKEAEWVVRGESWKLDSDTRFGNSALNASMTEALKLFNRSDCVIHAIDISGLKAQGDVVGTDQIVHGEDSLYHMAEETGGEFLKNANDLGSSFDRLLDRTGLIYILAFQPVRVPETGKFHTLTVKVKNKAYRVSHRTGYYEPKSYADLSPIEKKLSTSSALAAAVPKTDIPAWVLAAPFPAGADSARVPVIVEIPGDRLLASHNAPNMTVDLFVYAIDRQGQTRDYLFHTVGIELAKAREALQKGGIKYYGQLRLAAGEYTVRVLVRNNETGKFGVTVYPLTVPASADPFALPPLFVEEGKHWIMVKGKPRQATDAAAEYPFSIAGESFVPAALAGVKSGDGTRVCLIAYNFPSESSAIQYTARALGLDGRPRGKVELKLLKVSDQERGGARKLLLEFKPSGLDPGRYALAVRLQDMKTGKASENAFPFEVQ